MRLGFVGLGQMGRPIAHNLLKSGAELIVSDRTDRWFGEFRDKGVTATTNAADLAETDILFLCLPNTEVVQSFLLGESGVIGRLRQGQTVVDLSTIGYNATVEIGRALEAKSVASWTRRSPAWRRGPSRARSRSCAAASARCSIA